ncbi:YfiT family bacillithiol transferase [uncultured Winogradskyella sp.]|uniref:YfiT family bacillithiol transferase n=1 Tax=uncultured Winogradskyella sp. TaxID=395353 RepID=UPI002628D125|nr:putative metal-dependent hydrolase [uncultured Winogradskyella sp.]
MLPTELQKLKYPIGEFQAPDIISKDQKEKWITDIENFPNSVEEVTKNLSNTELSYRYRPDGWTIKQVVHHCADSHINSIIRFKLSLTEDTPTIRPYYENRWAELVDYEYDIETALSILKGIHAKLGILLRNLSDEDLKLKFIHPEHGKSFTLEETIGTYAWHSNHHLAHIKQALKYKGEF